MGRLRYTLCCKARVLLSYAALQRVESVVRGRRAIDLLSPSLAQGPLPSLKPHARTPFEHLWRTKQQEVHHSNHST